MAPNFINIIAVLYCVLCPRCSLLLHMYKDYFRRIIHIKSYNKLEVEMAQEYFDILKLIENIEHAFSLLSLLSLMAALCKPLFHWQDLWLIPKGNSLISSWWNIHVCIFQQVFLHFWFRFTLLNWKVKWNKTVYFLTKFRTANYFIQKTWKIRDIFLSWKR